MYLVAVEGNESRGRGLTGTEAQALALDGRRRRDRDGLGRQRAALRARPRHGAALDRRGRSAAGRERDHGAIELAVPRPEAKVRRRRRSRRPAGSVLITTSERSPPTWPPRHTPNHATYTPPAPAAGQATRPRRGQEDGGDQHRRWKSGGSTGGGIGTGGGTTAVCSATAQTGCSGTTTKCGLVGNHYGCQAPGTADAGEACTVVATGDSCQTGLLCFNGKCSRFCDPAGGTSACPSMQSCSLTVTWNGGPPNGERFNVCVVQGSECDPLAQDCATTTQACFPTNSGNKCLAPGTVADNMTCMYANDCTKGAACYDIGMGFKCYRFCSTAPDGGTTDAGVSCPSGTCSMISMGLGVCH